MSGENRLLDGLFSRLRSELDGLAQRVAMLMARFFPSVAALLAAFADARFFESRNAVMLGFVIAAVTIPQILDLGHTRRLTIEAALRETPEDSERQIQESFRAFALLSFTIACAISLFALGAVESLRGEKPLLVTTCLMAGISGALLQLNIALLYLRGSPRPLLAALLDPLLVLLFSASLVLRPDHAPALLASFLLLRSIGALVVAGYTAKTMLLLLQIRQGFTTLATEARAFGHLEIKLSLFCFIAWAIDPLLYGFFAADAGVAQHLLATRFAQLAINLINIFLIGGLWRSRSVVAARQYNQKPALALILCALLVISAASLWNATIFWGDVRTALIYGAVLVGAVAAIARQKATLGLLAGGGDVRSGASIILITLIAVLKAMSIITNNVIVLEVAAVAASLFYLHRMSRNV